MSSQSSLSINSKQRSHSPARSQQGSSVKRKPLHERTDSQTNEHPTIRLVKDPESVEEFVYSRDPFPTKSSQVLHPSSSGKRVPQDRDRHVSDDAPPPNPPASSLRIDSLFPAPLHPKTSLGRSTSTGPADNDSRQGKGSSYSPSSSRHPSATSSQLSAPANVGLDTSGREENEGDDTAAIPADVRPILPSLISKLDRELSSQPSETSLASSVNSNTLTVRQEQQAISSEALEADANASSTSLVLVERNPSRPLTARSRGSQRSITAPPSYPRPILKRSAESIASRTLLSQASIERLRTISNPSAPWHAALQATLNSGIRVQYPTVKPPVPPSTAGSWASVDNETPPPVSVPKRRSLRMNERPVGQSQWAPRPLSTIPSESERASHAFTEGSGVTTQVSSPIERRRTRGSFGSSFMLNATPEELGDLDRSLGKRPIRPDHDEHHDTLGELSSPYLHAQHSGSLARYSDPLIRPDSSLGEIQSKRSSYGSYIAATLPDWAKRYYSLGERTSLVISGLPNSSSTSLSSSRLNTADTGRSGSPDPTNVPLSIFHPRKRPRIQLPKTPNDNIRTADPGPSSSAHLAPPNEPRLSQISRSEALGSNPHRDRDSLAITEATVPPAHERLSVLRPLEARHVSNPISPHLRRDRRSTATGATAMSRRSMYRLSAWRAPSLEEVGAGCSWIWGPEGRQVVLFAIGFIFPIAWIVAAFLPLPKYPQGEMSEVGRNSGERGPLTRSQLDVEVAIVQEVGSIEERKYQKAMWWRWANRFMSVVGLVVIGAIVSGPAEHVAKRIADRNPDCTCYSWRSHVIPTLPLLVNISYPFFATPKDDIRTPMRLWPHEKSSKPQGKPLRNTRPT